MPVSWKLSLALGLALAAPPAAYGAQPTHQQHTRVYHHGTAVYRAAPPARALASVPNFSFWQQSATTSHQQYEIEGLTRDFDDCAKYGCIGNN